MLFCFFDDYIHLNLIVEGYNQQSYIIDFLIYLLKQYYIQLVFDFWLLIKVEDFLEILLNHQLQSLQELLFLDCKMLYQYLYLHQIFV
ncbi:MAG: hypothetical protein EBR82_70955 [Caulobacteraceae bacterium]|nr:hypothetical protein [Caulobacteraceae bacterium]